MADISRELQAIMSAIYGEEVRGSIHDAIEKINDVSEVVLSSGTDITGPTSPVTGYFRDSFYLNTETDDLWKCTGLGWHLEGNLRGSSISTIAKTGTSGLTDTYTITLTNGVTQTFTVTNGKGISSIAKTGTSGLVDTYTITFNDGSTTEFQITNGYSPTVTIGTKVGRDQPVTFTDKDGSQTIHIMDGVDGTGSSLEELSDVDLDTPTNNQFLRFNGATQKWENMSAGDLNGYNIYTDEAGYRTLEAQSDPVQGTGVYDPDLYYFLDNVNDEGWVETAWLTATASSTTSLVFNASTIGATNAASIHPTSRIEIAAEASNTKTMPQQGHNTVKPIAARIDYQDEGECQIVFDAQPVNTDFQLWIRND